MGHGDHPLDGFGYRRNMVIIMNVNISMLWFAAASGQEP